jgi:hypothetical protein
MSNIVGTFPVGIKPNGYQQLTVDGTARSLTVPAGSVRAVCVVEDNPIRWTDDGTTPTASVGSQAKADVIFTLYGKESLDAFKAIRTGSDAKLSISYYK